MDLMLATAPSDYAISWWPLWSAWLLAVLVLLFVRRPTRARRILGIACLGLGLAFYSWAVYVLNGCIEGYADWTSCDVAGASMSGAIALIGVSAVLALSNLSR